MVDTTSEQVGLPGRARQSRETLTDFWSDLEWLACSDGKARPTQPGLFPLAHGLRNRASQLRAYGNAIVPQVAAQFIEAVMEVIDRE
jgi:DNA (cytosine-5)-methyltransferase 1